MSSRLCQACCNAWCPDGEIRCADCNVSRQPPARGHSAPPRSLWTCRTTWPDIPLRTSCESAEPEPQSPGLVVAGGGVVVLSGEMLDTARKAGLIAALNRKRNGLPDGEYAALARACESALSEHGGDLLQTQKPLGA